MTFQTILDISCYTRKISHVVIVSHPACAIKEQLLLLIVDCVWPHKFYPWVCSAWFLLPVN